MPSPEKPIKKVVLAYSGGLDTSVIVKWLIEHYNCEVITFTADLGQGDELDGIEEKAKATGASKAYVKDLREEFLTDFVFPTLQAGAIYEHEYLLGTSFARPLIAKHMVEIADYEGADAVAHGATGKGNDQVRFEVTVASLNPQLRVIAPWRHPEWNIASREDAIEYAYEHDIPVVHTKEKIYSRDANLFHISHEGGELEDPWAEPNPAVYTLTQHPQDAPDETTTIEIAFEKGLPVALNGEAMSPLALMDALNKIGQENAIGRIDIVENRLVGMKSRGIYETPGGTILYKAHQALESICLDKETSHFKQLISHRYAELVYDGKWYSMLRDSLDGFIQKTQRAVTGSVRLDLYKGNLIVTGRKSPFSLFRTDFASFGDMDVYDQSDAEGFINLWGLPQKIEALISIDKTGQSRFLQDDYYDQDES